MSKKDKKKKKDKGSPKKGKNELAEFFAAAAVHVFAVQPVLLDRLVLWSYQMDALPPSEVDLDKALVVSRAFRESLTSIRYEKSTITPEIFFAPGSPLLIENVFLSESAGLRIDFVRQSGAVLFTTAPSMSQPCPVVFEALDGRVIYPVFSIKGSPCRELKREAVKA